MSAGRFPQRIKHGSSLVTIYKTPTKGYDAFTVVHCDATGGRCRRMFNSYAQALRAAKDTTMPGDLADSTDGIPTLAEQVDGKPTVGSQLTVRYAFS